MGDTDFVKPKAKVIGEDGNVYSIMAICSRALKGAGYVEKATEMRERIFAYAKDYNHALRIMLDYVEMVEESDEQ